MAPRRQRRFIVAGASALALATTAVALMPHAGPAGTAGRAAPAACFDAGYSRDRGRRLLIVNDRGNYWASYDRCE